MKTRLLIITFLVFVSIPLIYAQEQSVCSFEKDVPLSENYFVNDPTVVEFLKLYPEAKYTTDNAWEEPLPSQTYAQYLFKDLHLVFQILEYNPENTQECYFINGYKLFNQYTPNLNVLNFQKDPNVIIELLDTIKPRLRGGPQNIDAIQLERSTLDYSIPAPLKQMKLGIKLGHIICDKDKIPVWNIHYKPACVYQDSEYELIKRGWAKLRLLLPAGPDPIKELDWMGRNVMSMMLEGTFSYNSTPVETLDEKRAAIWEYSEQYHPGEQYLEYAIISHQYHYNVGDKVQFDLLEWGNYQNCWNLKLRIIDIHDESVYEDNSVRYCLEPIETPGVFHSYSMGKQFDEFVCEKPGYYRIKVSNENIFSPTILQNFACLESESHQETKDHLPPINSKNKWVNPELESKQESEITFDYVIESDNITYGSQYQISGGTVDEITHDAHSNSLIISLNESEKGYLLIVIQIGLLHSLDQSPFTYFVIADGEEVVFEQLSPIVLKIPFEKNTQKIEIIGILW